MNFRSKRTALWTAWAVGLCGAVLVSSSAEARRYKKKIVRHHVQQVAPPPQTSSGPEEAHLLPAYPATPAAAFARRARLSPAARAAHAAVTPTPDAFAAGFGGNHRLVAEARRHIGTNPTGMNALWCARFMNMVLERSGRSGTGSNMARSFASYGRRISGPQIGAIAVMSRGKRGGHVGIVSGIDAAGNPIIISGNHNRRVAETTYPRGRVYTYVMPH